MTDQTPGPDHTAELLTITEAALLLRAPVATLRYWRHLGTGPHSFRLGRRVVYRRDHLQAWIDACRHHGALPGRDARRAIALARTIRSAQLLEDLRRSGGPPPAAEV